MNFALTPEQEELQEAAIAFAQAELSAGIEERDRDGVFSRDVWQQLAEFGVPGLPVGQDFGGQGEGLMTVIAVMEGLGYGGRDQGMLFSLNASLWTNTIPVMEFGTAEQQAKYLPGLASGAVIGANAGTEPEAGSDIFSLTTRATRDGDQYVLNGAKTYVTNGGVADLYVAYATVEPAAGALGITAFLIESGTPGLSVGREIKKMGLRTSPMTELVLDNCRVPVSNRLGREGRGVEVFTCAMEWERGAILATCLGTMRRQLEMSIDYARTRRQFGHKIADFQAVTHRIVDMKVRLEAARLLVYRLGWLKDQGHPADLDAAMAKLFTSEASVQSSFDAMRTHGAYGYMAELGIEREMRDAIGQVFSSGTSDIQRNVIAQRLGL